VLAALWGVGNAIWQHCPNFPVCLVVYVLAALCEVADAIWQHCP